MVKKHKSQEEKNREKFLKEQVRAQRKCYPFRWLLHVFLPGVLMLLCLYGQTGIYIGQVQKGMKSFEDGYFYLPSHRSFVFLDDRALSPEEEEKFHDQSTRNYGLYLEKILPDYSETYAISPYLLQTFYIQHIELWGIDRNSYNNYGWTLKEGRGFSDEPADEILVIQGTSQVGDKITFFKDGRDIEMTVVGILDISCVPGTAENAKNKLIEIEKNPLSGNLNFTTDWIKAIFPLVQRNQYLVHPDSVMNDVSKVPERYGIFIKPGEEGERLKAILEKTGTVYSFGTFPNSITMKSRNFWLAWLLLFGMAAGGTLTFLWHDNKTCLLKWAGYLKIYRTCGMKEEEMCRMVWAVSSPWNKAGLAAALIFYIFILRWRQIVLITFLIGIIVFITYVFLMKNMIKRMVKRAICLEEKAALSQVCSGYPLAEDATVLDNLMLPLLYQGKTEEEIASKAKGMTGLFMLYEVRQEPCKNLSPREKLLTKLARAMMTEDSVEMEKNWDVLPEEEQEKLEEFLKKLEDSRRVQIVIREEDSIIN